MEPLAEILRRAHVVRQADPAPAPVAEVCPICQGAGYLRYDVQPEDDRFGELVACQCTARELSRRRHERLLERSNLGALGNLTFDTFNLKFRSGSPPRNSPDAAFHVAKRYAEGADPRPWLVFHGTFGTGKTHLAAAIANFRLAAGEPVVFIVVPDLLDHLRSTFSPTSDVTYDELFETVRNTSLLILDDLGAQTSTPWAQEKLYQVINHRYNKLLATVVTTNQSPDAIDPRLRSRLGDARLAQMLEIRDRDIRLGIEHQESTVKPSSPNRSGRKTGSERGQ